VPGWTRVDAGPFAALYLPADPLVGIDGANAALMDFAETLGPRLGASFVLASAALNAAHGDEAAACSMLLDLRTRLGEGSQDDIDAALEKAGDQAAWARRCP